MVKDEGFQCEIKDGQGVRGFRPSGRRSNDHWSPLDKPKIRKIREIRDLIKPLFRVSMVNQNFYPKVGRTKIFKYFSKDFRGD